MLGQRRRRWHNIKPALVHRDDSSLCLQQVVKNDVLMLGQRRRLWPNIKTTLFQYVRLFVTPYSVFNILS